MPDPILVIDNVSKSFKGRKAVNGLSFTVNEGEVFGFLGPNGAGKSTTIRMILSLLQPDAGDIYIQGRSVSRDKQKALTGVGALVEEPNFYKHLSAQKNLEILARMENINLSRVGEVLEIVELADRAGDKVKAYSHGMKQRLGIAQSLLKSPPLLVLDEPTSGLDPEHLKGIRDLILSLSGKGMTIILSSHLLHEVEQVCTAMAIVNKGSLVVSGPVQEMIGRKSEIHLMIKAEPIDQAKTILAGLNSVSEIESKNNIINCKTSAPALANINRTLVNAGIDITLFNSRTSLEEYYLSITNQARQ